MASVNKVIIVGALGRDPEVRYAPSGDAICNISVATSDTWKDKQTGDKKEATEWHRIVFFGKLAEIAGQYLKKGRPVYIEGSLKTRKWQDQSGQDRYTTEIRASEMQMLGGREEGQQEAPSQRQKQKQDGHQQQSGGFPEDDDIPFIRAGHGAAWRVI